MFSILKMNRTRLSLSINAVPSLSSRNHVGQLNPHPPFHHVAPQGINRGQSLLKIDKPINDLIHSEWRTRTPPVLRISGREPILVWIVANCQRAAPNTILITIRLFVLPFSRISARKLYSLACVSEHPSFGCAFSDVYQNRWGFKCLIVL
jgi:hypothetical protein